MPLRLSISIVFSGHIGGKQFAILRMYHRSAYADPKSPFFRNLVSLGSNGGTPWETRMVKKHHSSTTIGMEQRSWESSPTTARKRPAPLG